jgi:hypothetical protein
MSTGELSKARLGHTHDRRASYVERFEVLRIVRLISRQDDIHVYAIGSLRRRRAREDGDTRFRINR